MKIRFQRKAILTVIWFSFIFLLLQVSGFILFNFTTVRPIGSYGYPLGLYVWHPTLDYLYKPGFTGHFSGGPYQDISFRINGHGFRDDPFGPRSPGQRRLVFIGDSVVFGSGVWEKDRFTEQLQEDPGVRDADMEVLNLGVNSYNFGHYLELARLRFMDLSPDRVIVGFTLNDIQEMDRVWPKKQVKAPVGNREPGIHRKWYEKPLWVARVQKSMGRTYAGRFVEYSDQILKPLLMSKQKMKDYHTKWMRTAVRYWSEDSNRARLRGLLLEFKEEMSRQGVPFSFLIFPERNDLLRPGEYSLPRKSVTGMLDELEIGYCDAYDAFAATPDMDSLYLARDSVHFTPAGHRVIKDLLLACSEAGIIPVSTGRDQVDSPGSGVLNP
ncbi:SGNH/GDSL hydrolase family protein [bacterium]|nr:SGNH/GDSL hydrolase family protein [bacterium]